MFGEKIEFVIRHLLTSCKRAVISTLVKMFCLSVMHRMVVYMMRVPTHSTTLIEETKKVKKVLMMTRMNYRCCCGLFLYYGSLSKMLQGAPIGHEVATISINRCIRISYYLLACLRLLLFFLFYQRYVLY